MAQRATQRSTSKGAEGAKGKGDKTLYCGFIGRDGKMGVSSLGLASFQQALSHRNCPSLPNARPWRDYGLIKEATGCVGSGLVC